MVQQKLLPLLGGLLLVAVTFSAGYTARSGTAPPVRAEPAESAVAQTAPTGPQAVLEAYAAARHDLDFRSAYALLTPASQAAFTADEFASAYAGQRAYTFQSVEVEPARGAITRGYLVGLVLTGTAAYRYTRYPYTLRYEGGRWGVAQAAGLLPRIREAFSAGDWNADLHLVEAWLSIDPYAWEAYLERFYVFKDTARPEAARAAWDEAIKLSPPEDDPDLFAALGLLYLLNGWPDDLIATAQGALDLATKLGKEHSQRYDRSWRSARMLAMAYGYRFRGNDQLALEYFRQATALDPQNRDLGRFITTQSTHQS